MPTFQIDTSKVPDGTVLLFGIRYINDEYDDRQGYSKVFTYAALLAGSRWYLTGTGRVPQDAGWGAVQRWLDDPRREVVWVQMVTQVDTLFQMSPGQDGLVMLGGNVTDISWQPSDQ